MAPKASALISPIIGSSSHSRGASARTWASPRYHRVNRANGSRIAISKMNPDSASTAIFRRSMKYGG
ncbi:hypothetical protein D9M71_213840 [compost metagenome]